MTRLRPYARRALLVLLVAAAADRAGAAERLEASLERAQVPLGDRVPLTVTLHGLARAPLPRLPEVEGLRFHLVRQMSRVDLTGSGQPSLMFLYLVEAQALGTFELGPITISLPGRQLSTEPLTLTVVEGPAAEAKADLFTRATVSTKEPFVGQQILYTWRLYRRVRLVHPRLEPYHFEGFHAEELGDLPEYETILDGVPYQVNERRIALFPQRSGDLTIHGPSLRCGVVDGRSGAVRRIDGSFGGFTPKEKRLGTDPISLTVRELPAAPEGFSGLVGKFSLEASLSKTELRVGDSVVLRLEVAGNGSVDRLHEPAMPGLGGFKSYAEKPVSHSKRGSEGVSTKRVFSRALVPLEAGEAAIPGVALLYFDPEVGAYHRTTSKPLILNVLPTVDTEARTLAAAVVPRAALPEPGERAASPRVEAGGPTVPHAALVATAVLVPSLLLLGLVMMRRRSTPHADPGALRRARALEVAVERLAEVDAALEGPRAGDACCTASRILRAYLGDRLGYEGAAVTAAETAARLADSGLPEALLQEVATTLSRLEAGQFSGGCKGGPCATAQLRSLLERLDAASEEG